MNKWTHLFKPLRMNVTELNCIVVCSSVRYIKTFSQKQLNANANQNFIREEGPWDYGNQSYDLLYFSNHTKAVKFHSHCHITLRKVPIMCDVYRICDLKKFYNLTNIREFSVKKR